MAIYEKLGGAYGGWVPTETDPESYRDRLEGLKNLAVISLRRTKVSAGAIAHLKATLPRCEIGH